VQHSQQRPFVPRVTPTRAQPPVALADFAISRPFVPGADREGMSSLHPEYEGKIPPIEAFLDRAAPPMYARTAETMDDEASEDRGFDEDELPPVEHFIDSLPPVGDFAADAVRPEGGESGFEVPLAADAEPDSAAAEWGETDWQQYDWRAAAALGDSGDTEASNAWASTDWNAEAPHSRSIRPTPAQAIASALDQIAQRIREGEVPISGTPTDPGSIAASLAALFGIKR
jgi:hypothetical protein